MQRFGLKLTQYGFAKRALLPFVRELLLGYTNVRLTFLRHYHYAILGLVSNGIILFICFHFDKIRRKFKNH